MEHRRSQITGLYVATKLSLDSYTKKLDMLTVSDIGRQAISRIALWAVAPQTAASSALRRGPPTQATRSSIPAYVPRRGCPIQSPSGQWRSLQRNNRALSSWSSLVAARSRLSADASYPLRSAHLHVLNVTRRTFSDCKRNTGCRAQIETSCMSIIMLDCGSYALKSSLRRNFNNFCPADLFPSAQWWDFEVLTAICWEGQNEQPPLRNSDVMMLLSPSLELLRCYGVSRCL